MKNLPTILAVTITTVSTFLTIAWFWRHKRKKEKDKNREKDCFNNSNESQQIMKTSKNKDKGLSYSSSGQNTSEIEDFIFVNHVETERSDVPQKVSEFSKHLNMDSHSESMEHESDLHTANGGLTTIDTLPLSHPEAVHVSKIIQQDSKLLMTEGPCQPHKTIRLQDLDFRASPQIDDRQSFIVSSTNERGDADSKLVKSSKTLLVDCLSDEQLIEPVGSIHEHGSVNVTGDGADNTPKSYIFTKGDEFVSSADSSPTLHIVDNKEKPSEVLSDFGTFNSVRKCDRVVISTFPSESTLTIDSVSDLTEECDYVHLSSDVTQAFSIACDVDKKSDKVDDNLHNTNSSVFVADTNNSREIMDCQEERIEKTLCTKIENMVDINVTDVKPQLNSKSNSDDLSRDAVLISSGCDPFSDNKVALGVENIFNPSDSEHHNPERIIFNGNGSLSADSDNQLHVISPSSNAPSQDDALMSVLWSSADDDNNLNSSSPNDVQRIQQYLNTALHSMHVKPENCETSHIPMVSPVQSTSQVQEFCTSNHIEGGLPVMQIDYNNVAMVIPDTDMLTMQPLNIVTSADPYVNVLTPPLSNSDNGSEMSGDSGKGGSIIYNGMHSAQDTVSMYEINIPVNMCGMFIGKRGVNINHLKQKSNCSLSIRDHPYRTDLQVCSLEGTTTEIKKALQLIQRKYPTLDVTPSNLQTLQEPMPPELMHIPLPDRTCVNVIISSLVNVGHMYVHQPTQQSYSSLEPLVNCMATVYNQDLTVPGLPRPITPGVICAAPVMSLWYRAEIVRVMEESNECDIKFLDYGGVTPICTDSLRQIRTDFMNLPFQAVECYLANIVPLQDEEGFSMLATKYLEDMTQGNLLQAEVVGYAADGVPCINLYIVNANNQAQLINMELVNLGVVTWLDSAVVSS